MSLEGYLEDLGICDILQILSLSKKSGILTLSGSAGDGSITFLDGQVIRAASSQFPGNLGSLLCRQKITTREQIIAALTYQKRAKDRSPIGAILVEQHGIAKADIEAVVVRQIEAIVHSFFSWSRGTFVFKLEKPQHVGSATLNPLDFMLEKGVAPQSFVAKQQVMEELGPAENAQSVNEAKRQKKKLGEQDLGLLRGMLAELEDPAMCGGIILLILRYASELFRRAIIFDVRGRQLVGIGQFGLEGLSASADEIVRNMRMKAEPESLFGQVLQQQAALRGVLGSLADERFICEILGGQAAEVFIGPLVSDGKVVALLYGDNYPQPGTIKSANAFEVFLAQAGVEMERLLQGGTGF
ncbi:MAG TPA: DUF4388 domain-containing protein [Malonomonas sp.]